MKRFPFGIHRKATRNQGPQSRTSSIRSGPHAFRVPVLASEHIRDLRHSRIRNNIRCHCDPVSDFLRGRSGNVPRGYVWYRLYALGWGCACAVIDRLVSPLSW